MKYLITCTFCLYSFFLIAQRNISFSVQVPANSGFHIGLRGNVAPLSWDKSLFLEASTTGTFTRSIVFPNQQKLIEYKYVLEDGKGKVIWELDKQMNRLLLPTDESVTDQWNVPPQLDITRLPKISTDALLKDFEILKEAILTLHPGLYRYNTAQEVLEHLAQLKSNLQKDLSYAEAYLAFSRFLGTIRCGHTYANFFNQNTLIQQILLNQPDKLPFAFKIINKRIFITKNASEIEQFNPGTEIIAINGVPTAQILDSLLMLVKADGNNDNKRLNDLHVTGVDYFESFDVYFPLLFPPREEGYYKIEVLLIDNHHFTTNVKTINRKERTQRLTTRYNDLPVSLEDSWRFEVIDPKIGYLQLGTFVTWNFKMDWRKFLKECFKTLKKQKIEHLVIDIRDNEGGLDEVIEVLGSYLLKKDCQVENFQDRVRYKTIPTPLRSYLTTWDTSIYDLSKKVIPTEKGFYTLQEDQATTTFRAAPNAYKGKVYLVVNAGNSSATFYLARLAQSCGLATLVGQETGGSLRGINGGTLVFLRLPNSQIEMDIPVFGGFARSEQPAHGVKPDWEVMLNIEDLRNNKDTALEFIKKHIHLKDK